MGSTRTTDFSSPAVSVRRSQVVFHRSAPISTNRIAVYGERFFPQIPFASRCASCFHKCHILVLMYPVRQFVFFGPILPEHYCCLQCFEAYCNLCLRDRLFSLRDPYGYTIGCTVSPWGGLIIDAHHFRLLGADTYDRYQRQSAEVAILGNGAIFCRRVQCRAAFMCDRVDKKPTDFTLSTEQECARALFCSINTGCFLIEQVGFLNKFSLIWSIKVRLMGSLVSLISHSHNLNNRLRTANIDQPQHSYYLLICLCIFVLTRCYF